VPGLPPVAATVPGYELVGVNGLWAPAKTPDALIKRLNQEVVKVLNKPDVKESFFNAGVEVVGNTPDQFADHIKTDIAKMGKLIRDAGIRAD
jgi:tripartite-type tricarboxylate transporter receptor subunit TctC